MAIDAVVTVLYNGEPLVEVDSNGQHVIHASTVGHMRVNGGLIDVSNKLPSRLQVLNEQVRAGSVNPFRDALMKGEPVYQEIPQRQRRGMTRRDISTVMDAIMRIATRGVQ